MTPRKAEMGKDQIMGQLFGVKAYLDIQTPQEVCVNKAGMIKIIDETLDFLAGLNQETAHKTEQK